MERPLWQILLPMFLLAFAARRAALAFVLWDAEQGALMGGGHALVAALALLTTAGVWWGTRWGIGALLALGAGVAATALLGAFSVGSLPPFAAFAQIGVAAVASAGLALFLRHELGASGTARTPERPRPRKPSEIEAEERRRDLRERAARGGE